MECLLDDLLPLPIYGAELHPGISLNRKGEQVCVFPHSKPCAGCRLGDDAVLPKRIKERKFACG
jgi:hypothetical protein